MTLSSTPHLTILQPQVSLADPHIASDNKDRLSILAAMLEALVGRDKRGHYRPALAESWQVTDDARIWTFTLRPGVACHNGDPLTAADAAASIERACDPALGGDLGTEGLYQSYLKGAQITPLDAQTLRLTLARPMADLLDLLVDIPIVPQRALADLPDRPVGSGPYQGVEVQPGRVVLEAFPDYWAGLPPVAQLFWQAEPDDQRRVELLLAGEADLIAQVPPESRSTLAAAAEVQLLRRPSSVCTVFMANLQTGVCTDRRVRQALNYALDVPALIERVLNGAAQPLNGPLTDLHFGYDPATPAYPYDPARASALLAEAGYGGGLELTLDVPTRLPDEAVPLARLMAGQYAQVGITTHIREFTDRPGYATRVKTKQIGDACCFDSSPLSTYRCLREKFHSRVAGPWWQGYANPEVDALLNRAETTVDEFLRQTFYRRAYRLIRDDAPWIFLHNPTLIWAAGPRTHGWQPGIDGLIRVL